VLGQWVCVAQKMKSWILHKNWWLTDVALLVPKKMISWTEKTTPVIITKIEKRMVDPSMKQQQQQQQQQQLSQ
jgi:hypothetical protein